MSLLNSVLKVFVGDKSKQDVKAIMPIVHKIKTFEAATAALSNDALRAKTQEFKSTISEACKALEDSIATLYVEADTTEDIDRKEEIYLEIDGLKDEVYAQTQEVLDAILPEAYSVIKETAKRFVNNPQIEVTASPFDRELSGTKRLCHFKWRKSLLGQFLGCRWKTDHLGYGALRRAAYRRCRDASRENC